MSTDQASALAATCAVLEAASPSWPVFINFSGSDGFERRRGRRPSAEGGEDRSAGKRWETRPGGAVGDRWAERGGSVAADEAAAMRSTRVGSSVAMKSTRVGTSRPGRVVPPTGGKRENSQHPLEQAIALNYRSARRSGTNSGARSTDSGHGEKPSTLDGASGYLVCLTNARARNRACSRHEGLGSTRSTIEHGKHRIDPRRGRGWWSPRVCLRRGASGRHRGIGGESAPRLPSRRSWPSRAAGAMATRSTARPANGAASTRSAAAIATPMFRSARSMWRTPSPWRARSS